jgi:hypothetical protein
MNRRFVIAALLVSAPGIALAQPPSATPASSVLSSKGDAALADYAKAHGISNYRVQVSGKQAEIQVKSTFNGTPTPSPKPAWSTVAEGSITPKGGVIRIGQVDKVVAPAASTGSSATTQTQNSSARAALTATAPPAELAKSIDTYISGLYAKAAKNPADPGQIFKSAPDKADMNTTPITIGPFDTAGAKVTQPQFAGTMTQPESVHFTGGLAYFTKDGRNMWFNTEGGGWGKATSGLWYGPIPTGK